MKKPARRPVDSLDLELEIDRLCDEFERAGQAGEDPRIEDYLNRTSDAGRKTLLRELILAEREMHRNDGHNRWR